MLCCHFTYYERKYMKKIVMLIISLFGMFPLVAKQKTDLLKEHAGVSWCMHRAMHAFE